jgi:hypothetical protein
MTIQQTNLKAFVSITQQNVSESSSLLTALSTAVDQGKSLADLKQLVSGAAAGLTTAQRNALLTGFQAAGDFNHYNDSNQFADAKDRLNVVAALTAAVTVAGGLTTGQVANLKYKVENWNVQGTDGQWIVSDAELPTLKAQLLEYTGLDALSVAVSGKQNGLTYPNVRLELDNNMNNVVVFNMETRTAAATVGVETKRITDALKIDSAAISTTVVDVALASRIAALIGMRAATSADEVLRALFLSGVSVKGIRTDAIALLNTTLAASASVDKAALRTELEQKTGQPWTQDVAGADFAGSILQKIIANEGVSVSDHLSPLDALKDEEQLPALRSVIDYAVVLVHSTDPTALRTLGTALHRFGNDLQKTFGEQLGHHSIWMNAGNDLLEKADRIDGTDSHIMTV